MSVARSHDISITCLQNLDLTISNFLSGYRITDKALVGGCEIAFFMFLKVKRFYTLLHN